jgi:hypothetical protein
MPNVLAQEFQGELCPILNNQSYVRIGDRLGVEGVQMRLKRRSPIPSFIVGRGAYHLQRHTDIPNKFVSSQRNSLSEADCDLQWVVLVQNKMLHALGASGQGSSFLVP